MRTAVRCGMAVAACLLLAGVILARPAGNRNTATVGRASGFVHQVPLPGRLAAIAYDNDVGVAALLPTPDLYMSYGDTLWLSCVVKNYGTQTQTHIPVSCVIHRSTGVTVFAQTVFVDSLGAGDVDTVVTFPLFVPPGMDMVYYDTMATALPGDEDTSNDWKAGRITVSASGIEEQNAVGRPSFSIGPNPLRGPATVRYSLPRPGLAKLEVYDAAGQEVLSKTLSAGRTGTAGLDLRKLQAGVYLVKVAAEGFSTTQKLVVRE